MELRVSATKYTEPQSALKVKREEAKKGALFRNKVSGQTVGLTAGGEAYRISLEITFKGIKMEYLRNEVRLGRDHLVIELVTGTARLSGMHDTFRRPGGPGPMQIVVIDLGVILERFEHDALPREVFTLREVATMAKEKPPTVHSWVKAGILAPSMRDRDGTRGRAMLFSRLDAFVACLIASLRRKCGLPLAKLRAVSAVLREPDAGGRNGGEVPTTITRSSEHANSVKAGK